MVLLSIATPLPQEIFKKPVDTTFAGKVISMIEREVKVCEKEKPAFWAGGFLVNFGHWIRVTVKWPIPI